MKVELDKTFPMPGGVDAAWAFLQDIEGVASCMPGARITERVDDSHYKGTVSVKVGPATMAFKGDIEVQHVDAANRTVRLLGKGSDSTGASGASMDLTARVVAGADAASSGLIGRSEITVNGKAAAFGGRMMASVTDQILKQFAANFATNVERLQSAASAVGETGADHAAAEPVPSSGSDPAARTPTPPAPARELNAFALLWGIVRDWLRGLFGRKAA